MGIQAGLWRVVRGDSRAHKKASPVSSGRHRPAKGRYDRIRRARRYQLLPSPQRYGAVAAARDLSDPERRVRSQLRADRPAVADLSDHRLAAAAGRRPLYRSPAAALFAAGRHGLHAPRASDLRLRAELRHAARRRRRCWGSALPSSTRNPRASRGSPRAAPTAWRNRCSRSAAISARRSGRCWPRSSFCRAARRASPGSRSSRSPA